MVACRWGIGSLGECANWAILACIGFGCSVDSRAVTVPGALQPVEPAGDGGGQDGGGGEAVRRGGLVAEPESLDFGSVLIGSFSSQELVLRNVGPLESDVPTLTLAGGAPADYSIESNLCEGPLGPGASCRIRVQFHPSASGARDATLAVRSLPDSSIGVRLFGAGLMPGALRAAGMQHDFGGVEVSTEGSAFLWSIQNTGAVSSGPLSIISSNEMDFPVDSDCPGELGASASCTVSVSFTPSSPGRRSGSIAVQTSGAGAISLSVEGNSQVRLTVLRDGAPSGRVSSIAVSSADDQWTNNAYYLPKLIDLDCGDTCTTLVDAGTMVSLQAVTENGSGVYFSGWSAGGCVDPRDPRDTRPRVPRTLSLCQLAMNASTTVTATFSTMDHNLMFVAARLFGQTGNLGSAAAFDIICNQEASSAGINTANGDGYVAVVSDSTSLFTDRMVPGARGWARMDGRIVADTLDGLLADDLMYHAVRFNHFGNSAGGYWTGMSTDGTLAANCNDWTSEDPSDGATIGVAYGGPGLWLDSRSVSGTDFSNNELHRCDFDRPVLCMGHTRTTAATPEVQTGKRAWVTRETFLPGSGAPDAFCDADRPPGVASAAALVRYEGRPHADMLDASATYVRTDGVPWSTGALLQQWVSPWTGLWLGSDGTLVGSVDAAVWTGGFFPSIGYENEPLQTCNNWTSESGAGTFTYVRSEPQDSLRSRDCSQPAHLYCVER